MDVGRVLNSAKFSIGTKTVFAPFSDSKVILSGKFIALSIAPPIDILPITAPFYICLKIIIIIIKNRFP
jgi:hypothetical protein